MSIPQLQALSAAVAVAVAAVAKKNFVFKFSVAVSLIYNFSVISFFCEFSCTLFLVIFHSFQFQLSLFCSFRCCCCKSNLFSYFVQFFSSPDVWLVVSEFISLEKLLLYCCAAVVLLLSNSALFPSDAACNRSKSVAFLSVASLTVEYWFPFLYLRKEIWETCRNIG